jgi:catechol 2,3-dioxygenase-like lactoylglutathione lyase family enzyme
MIKFNEATVRILVRKDYGKCFDFYTKKLGLIPNWEYSAGDNNGPYTSFSMKEGGAECLALFKGDNMKAYKGYTQPNTATQPDTIVFCMPSDNFDEDYKRLKEAGIDFIGDPQTIEEWGMKCVYFRDPEGNLLELNGEIKK